VSKIETPSPEILEVLIPKIAAPIREHVMRSGRTPESKVAAINALACVAGIALYGASEVEGVVEFFEGAVRNQMARQIAEAIKRKAPEAKT
jgi:hypothetical protein